MLPATEVTVKQKYQLSFDDLETICGAILAARPASGTGYAAAIVDEHGELMSFFRTDDCPVSAVRIACNKAFTAARDRQETQNLKRLSGEFGFSGTDLGDLRYTRLGGGVPILHKGQVVGAVGVSGMSEEEDHGLAETGAAAVGE